MSRKRIFDSVVERAISVEFWKAAWSFRTRWKRKGRRKKNRSFIVI